MKKFILFLFLTSFMTGGFLYYYRIEDKEQKIDNKVIESEMIDDSEAKEDIENEPITEVIEDDIKSNENISNVNDNANKNNMESNNVSNSNVVNNKAKIEVKEEQKKEESTSVVNNTTEPPKKEQTAWESLGISEYDYYNSPMWSWARVDYSVKNYGNFEQTHQACIDAGNNMEDIISFSCTNINSYSGDYLGDMLRVKY